MTRLQARAERRRQALVAERRERVMKVILMAYQLAQQAK